LKNEITAPCNEIVTNSEGGIDVVGKTRLVLEGRVENQRDIEVI